MASAPTLYGITFNPLNPNGPKFRYTTPTGEVLVSYVISHEPSPEEAPYAHVVLKCLGKVSNGTRWESPTAF